MKSKLIVLINPVFLIFVMLCACKKTDNLVPPNVSVTTVTTVATSVNYALGVPVSIAIDPQGNIYEPYTNIQYNVAISLGHLQEISPSGMVSGYDGYYFSQIVIDYAGNFYGSTGNNIVKVNFGNSSSELAGDTLTSGYVDSMGYSAKFGEITCLTTDSNGNLYVGDLTNLVIRKVTPSGLVTTFAGNGIRGSVDGSSSIAEFEDIQCIGIDSHSNIYVSDVGANRIRKITPSGIVSTVATNVTAYDMTVDPEGNVYFIQGNAIDKIDSSGNVSSIAGASKAGNNDGDGNDARFNDPNLLISDKHGNIFVADFGNDAIRKITIN